MQNQRKVLVSALLKAEKDGFSNIILDNILNQSDLSSLEKAFITFGFYGVLERKKSIDYVLNKFLKKPIEKAPPYTRAVLRSGAYQIIFMDKVPSSAAVNESVKLIKKSKENGNSGLVNAVLRKIAAENFKEQIENSSDAEVKFSVNKWIYNSVCNDYTSDIADAFFKETLNTPNVFVRLNNLKKSAFELVSEELAEMNAKLVKTESDDIFIAQGLREIETLNTYKNGYFFVQDYSSYLAAKALEAKPGDKILDCCAAPGGKSFSIALNMENIGQITSCDIFEGRVSLIKKGAERLGINIIESKVCDASKFDTKLGEFDKVICDAPCSGIGVIGRKPEIKYKDDSECSKLPELQNLILQNVSKYVKSGGTLIYSTCTLLKRENQEVVENFLSNNSDFYPVPVFEGCEQNTLTRIPPKDMGDGFFIAKMKRV